MIINCPNCGKQISDKAKKCIHCEFVLGSKPTVQVEKVQKVIKEKRQYDELEQIERDELLWKFGKDEPLQYKEISAEKKRLVGELITGGVAILLTIIGIIILATVGKNSLDVPQPSVGDFLLALGPIGLGVLMWIAFAVLRIMGKVSRQRKIIAFKHFEQWLNKRGIVGFAEMQMDDAIERKKLQDLDD